MISAEMLASLTLPCELIANSGQTNQWFVGTSISPLAGICASAGCTTALTEKEFFEKMRPSSLIKRFATTDEIASLVAYIASPLASATNGAALRAEGGLLRSIL